MKNRFIRMLSVICAIMLLTGAVSVWAAADKIPATPTDITPEETEHTPEEPGEEPQAEPEEETPQENPEENPEEIEAAAAGLSYVALDGNIGCLVNGAGLAMATMDIIKSLGGEPANFLDVGGSASVEKVSKAFSILLRSPKVKAIMVNIFGGIMRCDVIAAAIIEAAKTIEISVPIVVRLEGTNADLGKEMLRNSGITLIPAHSFRDAVEKAVAAANGGN